MKVKILSAGLGEYCHVSKEIADERLHLTDCHCGKTTDLRQANLTLYTDFARRSLASPLEL